MYLPPLWGQAKTQDGLISVAVFPLLRFVVTDMLSMIILVQLSRSRFGFDEAPHPKKYFRNAYYKILVFAILWLPDIVNPTERITRTRRFEVL